MQFARRRTTALALRLEERDDKVSIVSKENCSFGSVRDIVIISTMWGFWRIGNTLTGKELLGDADLAFPIPTYATRFAGMLPGGIAFDRPDNRLVFDRKYLDLRLTMADPGALKLARDQCERELDRLGYQKSTLARVRTFLAAEDRELPSLGEMANKLGTSERTLKRRLAEERASYSDLVGEVQLARATTLLRSELTVEEIATRLGYSDSANFTRAFRRWTGKTPTAFRSG